jgi:hypothetical protein
MSKYDITNRNIRLLHYYRIPLLITTVFIIAASIMISFSSVNAFDQAKEYVFVKK